MDLTRQSLKIIKARVVHWCGCIICHQCGGNHQIPWQHLLTMQEQASIKQKERISQSLEGSGTKQLNNKIINKETKS